MHVCTMYVQKMNLEYIMLSQRSQTQKAAYWLYGSTYIKYPDEANP